jgi:hypothetical protein
MQFIIAGICLRKTYIETQAFAKRQAPIHGSWLHYRRMKRRQCLHFPISLVLGLTGCALCSLVLLISVQLKTESYTGLAYDVASPTPARATATALPNSIGPDSYPPNMNPLTGLVVEDPASLERRPLAIKVSNAPDSVRPQAGLARADLVFEHYVEGYLTRFTAIFYTNTPRYVGSVRSARLIDLQIPLMYQSLLAYSGASGPIQARISEGAFANRAFQNIGAPLFYRDPAIEIPHNLFVVPAQVWARATARGVNGRPDLHGMQFHKEAPPGALSLARKIVVRYGPDVVEWQYNAESEVYFRTLDGELHVDALDGMPIAASNVIVLWAHHQEDVTIVENEWQGHRSYSTEIQIWTLGPVILFRDGLRYDGYWHRWQDNAMLTFWGDDTMTEALYLKPGATWFEVVPLDFTGLTISVDG